MKSFNAQNASHSGLEAAKKTYFTYVKFATACKVRLERFVKENPSKTSMVYAVPLVLPGAALFDPKQAINHVIHVLKKDGFGAEYIGENLIFIHWSIKALPQYQVHDYVASSIIKSRHPLKAVSDAGALQGPGVSHNVNTQRVSHTKHIDSEIKRRMTYYMDDESSKNMRKIYSNSTTHDQVLNKMARFHSIL